MQNTHSRAVILHFSHGETEFWVITRLAQVTEVVTGRVRTIPRTSDSGPWVLESEIRDEVTGGALSPGSAVLKCTQSSGSWGTTLLSYAQWPMQSTAWLLLRPWPSSHDGQARVAGELGCPKPSLSTLLQRPTCPRETCKLV